MSILITCGGKIYFLKKQNSGFVIEYMCLKEPFTVILLEIHAN